MANLPGLTHTLQIKDFRGDDHSYRWIISELVKHGHSFAVHGGLLYMSDSGTDRVIDLMRDRLPKTVPLKEFLNG